VEETQEHVLLHCPQYRVVRTAVQQQLNDHLPLTLSHALSTQLLYGAQELPARVIGQFVTATKKVLQQTLSLTAPLLHSVYIVLRARIH
jgi:hypothetical protein